MSTHNIRAIDWSSCQESNDMCLSHIRKDSVLFDNSLSLKLDHTKNVRNSSPFSSIICDEIKFDENDFTRPLEISDTNSQIKDAVIQTMTNRISEVIIDYQTKYPTCLQNTCLEINIKHVSQIACYKGKHCIFAYLGKCDFKHPKNEIMCQHREFCACIKCEYAHPPNRTLKLKNRKTSMKNRMVSQYKLLYNSVLHVFKS
jgi:hypothetical protein